jgi:hypothetical protein
MIRLILTFIVGLSLFPVSQKTFFLQKNKIVADTNIIKKNLKLLISDDIATNGPYYGWMTSIGAQPDRLYCDNFTADNTTHKLSGDFLIFYTQNAPIGHWIKSAWNSVYDWNSVYNSDSTARLSRLEACKYCAEYMHYYDSAACPEPITEHYQLSGFAIHDSVYFNIDTVYPLSKDGKRSERHYRFQGKCMKKFNPQDEYTQYTHFIMGTFIDSTSEFSYGSFNMVF